MKHVIILITLMVLVLVLKAKNDKDFRKYLKFVLIKIPLSFIFKYNEDPMDEFRKFMIDRMSQRTHRIYITSPNWWTLNLRIIPIRRQIGFKSTQK